LQNEKQLSFLIHHVCIYLSIYAFPTLCIRFQHVLCLAFALSPTRINSTELHISFRIHHCHPLHVPVVLGDGLPARWHAPYPGGLGFNLSSQEGQASKGANKYWPDIGVELYFKISSMKKLDLSELKVI
jgi:hypothetical protein